MNQAQELLSTLRKEIVDLGSKSEKRMSAKVISNNYDGTATVVLAGDATNTSIIAQNPRELFFDVNDDVYIIPIGGKLTNCFVDCVKTYIGNIIYQDFTTGNDDTGDGSSSNPYKTISKALNVLPKNLQGRTITIYYNSLNSDGGITVSDFYGGGRLNIWPGTSPSGALNSLFVKNCFGAVISVIGISINTITNAAITIDTSRYVEISGAIITGNTASYDGVIVSGASTAHILNTSIIGKSYGIEAVYMSTVFSQNNSGTNIYGLTTFLAGTIVKNGTQPTGTTANEYSSTGGSIR